MRMIKVLGIGVALGGWAGSNAAETKMPLAKIAPKVSIDAARLRSTKTEGGDFDDKRQIVQLEVVVKSLNLNAKTVEGLTLNYWAFAQSTTERKAFKVIDAGSFEVTLNNTPAGREIRHQGKEVTLQYDDTGVARFGTAYKGFLLVLLNAQREVVAVKANQPSWQSYFERAFDLKAGSWCDLNLKPTAAPHDEG